MSNGVVFLEAESRQMQREILSQMMNVTSAHISALKRAVWGNTWECCLFPSHNQSVHSGERREGIKTTSIVLPMVWYGMTWYGMVWRGIHPPNNHTSRLINHYSCHLAQLIHRIQNLCDDQFDFNCLLFSEEEPDHYCHRASSFSKLHISWNNISRVFCLLFFGFGWSGKFYQS